MNAIANKLIEQLEKLSNKKVILKETKKVILKEVNLNKIHSLHKEYDKDYDDRYSPNPEDTITLDIPLFIRLLEYAKEDAKTDMDLHKVAENAVKLSSTSKTLAMSDYNKLIL